jgi:hypothetical protein
MCRKTRFLGGLDQERKIEAEIRWRAWRGVNLRTKECDERLGCRGRNICHQDIENGERMAGCLSRYKLVAALNGRLATVVGIRRRALALLAAIRRFLIELPAGEAIERTYKQQECQNRNGDVHGTAHPFHISIS